MRSQDTRVRRSLFCMVVVALAVRFMGLGFLYPEQLSPDRDHFAFGYETGRIARAIASGEGFSSPLLVPTGPTAWMAPAYPYVVAGVFKVFGIYSKASVLVILTLQDLFSALTCLTVFFIGQRTFGPVVAGRAGWIWAFFPYAVFVPNHWVWDASLTTLLFSLLFLMALRLEHSRRLREWLGFGLLWGLGALTNPVLLSVLPFLLSWLWWRQRQHGVGCGRSISATALIFLLSVLPWFVRNYQTFGQVIFFRSTFGAVLRMGNSEDTGKPRSDALLPSENEDEMARFRRMGELAYMVEKRHDAFQFIASHPGTFAWLTLRRIVYFWMGIWNLTPAYLVSTNWPLLGALNIVFSTSLSVLAFLGLRRGIRDRRAEVWPYLIVLFFFPLVYYVTSPHIRFRHPIDPLIVLLAAYAACKDSSPHVG